MKRSAFDESRDQRVGEEQGVSRQFMCAAHGCPNRWSTSVGHVCRWHAEAQKEQWPEVTQQLQWDETERARANGEPPPYVAPVSFEEKKATLRKLTSVFVTDKAPKAWAHRLKAREARGDRLNAAQKAAWRAALHSPIEAGADQ